MGQCLEKNSKKQPKTPSNKPETQEKATTTPSNQVSVDVKSVKVALPQAETPAEKDADIPGMYRTKGDSLVLPADSKRLLANRDEQVPSETKQIAEFLEQEVMIMEEDFDSPYYMKIDKTYKVGDDVVYPPEMEQNMSFILHPKAEGKDDDEVGDVLGGTTVTFGYKSLQGRQDARGAPDKPNQDSVAVVRNKGAPHRAIFGVFDGHGPFGEHASHFCRMEMLRMYSIALRQHPDDSPQQLLSHTLRYLDRKFGSTDHKTSPIDPIVSGTTAIVIMLDGDDIIAANVGDSRAILATRDDPETISIIPLSDDHKPERPDERRRIEASSAILLNENEVRNRRNPHYREEQNPNAPPPKTYICRYTNGEIVYGVLFTRSIGDVDAHKHLGVSSEPEFRKAKVSEGVDDGNEQVIILGSDGIWDMMNNEEVASIALSEMDPLRASEKIVQIAADRWAVSGEGRRDDITVCIVGLGIKFGTNSAPRDAAAGSFYGVI